MSTRKAIFLLVRGLLSDRAQLAAENLALRQQLAILNKKPLSFPKIPSAA